MRCFRKVALFTIMILMIVSLVACGSVSGSKNAIEGLGGSDTYENSKGIGSVDSEQLYDSQSDATDKSDTKSDSETVKAAPSADKLVYTARFSIETTDYKTTMSELSSKMKEYGGIIESQNETDNASNWYYSDYKKTSGTLVSYITVRIPSPKFNDFIANIEGTGKIVSKEMDAENITSQYNDNEASIKALEVQQGRLLTMLENADSIDDMLTIEGRLTTVETQLNQLKTNRDSMDSKVAYSTVNFTVREVVEYGKEVEPEKTETFWDRLGNTAKETWSFTLAAGEWLLFFMIRIVPVVIFCGIVTWIIVVFIKRGQKKRKNATADVSGPYFSQPSSQHVTDAFDNSDMNIDTDNCDRCVEENDEPVCSGFDSDDNV